jgi:hypothetical protein
MEPGEGQLRSMLVLHAGVLAEWGIGGPEVVREMPAL